MYHHQRDSLRRNHVTLVDELDPNDVFDQLQQDGVLTESDHELINTGKTRKERCRMLLGILPTRGPDAYGSFKNALKQSCSHLEQLLQDGPESTTKAYESVDECFNNRRSSDSQGNKQQLCSKCQLFIPIYIIDPGLRRALQQNCCLILHNIEANDLLDLLYQESILDRHDCEFVKSKKTRRDRCIAMLRKLSTCLNRNMFNVFKESLRKKYGYIAKQISKIYHDSSLAMFCGPGCDVRSEAEVVMSDARAILSDTRCSYPILREVMRRGLGVDTAKLPASNTRLAFGKMDVNAMTNMRKRDKHNIGKMDLKTTYGIDLSRAINTTCCQKARYHTNCCFPSSKLTTYCPTAVCSDSSEEDNLNKAIRQRQTTRIKHKRGKNVSSEIVEYIPYHPTYRQTLPESCEIRKRGQETVFNSLSTLINQGQYEQFEKFALGIQQKQSSDKDIMCILDYLFASRFLHAADVDSAKTYIESGLKLAQATSYPKYFTLEFLTSQTRMLSIKRKFEKLQRTLDDAKMMIEADPACCTGRAAGWLYMNDVKHLMVQISMLNTKRSNYPSVYEHLYKLGKNSCEKSLDHFKREEGNDGPFGFVFALCRLIILLLRCGDRGMYKVGVSPSAEDIELAGRYLRQIEDSDIPIPTFLKVPLLLAKSDYHYRRQHIIRALEYAEEAFILITKKSILEFKEQALNRMTFLRTQLDAETNNSFSPIETRFMNLPL
ncbi:uncharacterized protein LOC117323289 [Pecten maximus]|uniref:uncharacterized protein LOC117323289 n=1 Tax=Pecten maximus TaxID=6579 RepID=UPI0014584E79|nr:uncharacterized protein LOC117323289 [Pecten maximus]